jgi:hypothetical protein
VETQGLETQGDEKLHQTPLYKHDWVTNRSLTWLATHTAAQRQRAAAARRLRPDHERQPTATTAPPTWR